MLQVGQGLGFALEALPQVRPLRQMSGQGLDGDEAVQARVAGLINLPIPPLPISARIS